jgi:hypothetical protein
VSQYLTHRFNRHFQTQKQGGASVAGGMERYFFAVNSRCRRKGLLFLIDFLIFLQVENRFDIGFALLGIDNIDAGLASGKYSCFCVFFCL